MKLLIFKIRIRIAYMLWVLLQYVCPMPMHVLLTIISDPKLQDISLAESA